MAAGNGAFVGLTDGLGGRTIYASHDGRNWVQAQAEAIEGMSHVEFAGAQFVIVGDGGLVLTSADGFDWRSRQSNAPGSFKDFAFGNGTALAIGYGPAVYVSEDLERWTTRACFGTGFSMREVAFGNGIFVVIGEPNRMFISANGLDWSEASWPQDLEPVSWYSGATALEFSNGRFLISVNSAKATSVDGQNWEVESQNNLQNLIPLANGFLGLGAGTALFSKDGQKWNSAINYHSTSADQTRFLCGADLNGKRVVGGENGVLFLDEGKGFECVIPRPDYGQSLLAFANNLFVRYGAAGGLFKSRDGSAWGFVSGTPGLRSLAGGAGLWFGITTNGAAVTSTNLADWIQLETPEAFDSAAHFANGRFMAGSGANIFTSTDLSAWTKANIAAEARAEIIGNLEGRWLIMVDDQRPAISDDGVHFTVYPPQASMRGRVWSAGNGRFIGIGGGGMGPGMASWSTNGVDWQEKPLQSGTTHMETTLTFGDGRFVLGDSNGGLFESTDGLHWIGEQQVGNRISSVTFAAGKFVAAAGDAILKSGGGLPASATVSMQIQRQDLGWALAISGSAGQQFQLQAAESLGSRWTSLAVVDIPATGSIIWPVDITGAHRFFKMSPLP